MKTCSKCGYTTENDHAKFCKKCGTRFIMSDGIPKDAVVNNSDKLHLDNTPSFEKQKLEISSCKLRDCWDFGISAQTHPRLDNNGDSCFLLKIELPIEGMHFTGNIIGDILYRHGTYYVYMSQGINSLTLSHKCFETVELSNYFRGTSQRGETYTIQFIIPNKRMITEPLSKSGLTGRQCYAKGLELYKEDSYEEAFLYFEQGAKLDDSDAQYYLGFFYLAGINEEDFILSQDFSKARFWFEKSAEGGNLEAYAKIGKMLYYGLGCGIDIPKSIEHFEHAAKYGVIEAQSSLAAYYFDQKDYEKTLYWCHYSPNFEEKLPPANLRIDDADYYGHSKCILGIMYLYGLGVGQNLEKAYSLFDSSWMYWSMSHYYMGVCLQHGYGCNVNIHRAKYHYKQVWEREKYEPAQKALLDLEDR